MKKIISRKIFSLLGSLLLIALFILLIILLVTKITGRNPSLFGYSLYIVVTGSMEPDLSVGDVILTKNYDPDSRSAEVGDTVTYRGTKGSLDGKLVTHRIIEINDEPDGTRSVTCQGIANDYPDPSFPESDVVSVYICKTVVLTRIHSVLTTPFGFITLYIIPVVVFIISEMLGIITKKKKLDAEITMIPASGEDTEMPGGADEKTKLYLVALSYLEKHNAVIGDGPNDTITDTEENKNEQAEQNS